MPEKMIEVFSRRPGRGEYLLSAARAAGWAEKTGLRLLEAGCGLGAASKLLSERARGRGHGASTSTRSL